MSIRTFEQHIIANTFHSEGHFFHSDIHRGGEDFLLDQGGTDVTELFKDAGHSGEANAILATLEIGTVRTEVGCLGDHPRTPGAC
ncbi:hypothetical protein NW755_013000 [Fusarium falciforme]|uniref:Cytochrome b5 heme-binding domain-containing protein n=1 Tax=Fusarium falciforme TaxID=195108 RepID=A0A9W8QW50_9HYPO|nr:hypothetical protein NW755_013000 [Fusarium falciforme]